MREDLFKKFASGDGIAGRKPYGFCTRMIHCVGWKRLEANRMFTFDDVDKRNFNAIMRRSLVWRVKARFEDPQVIAASYSDIFKDGVFPKDPDLQAFLVSSQAVAAGLQLQHAFEAQYSKEECLGMIENYVSWGGDFGLTETTMRKACKLPPRDVTSAVTNIAAAIDVEEHDEDKEEMEKWRNLHAAVVDFMLIKKKLQASPTMFNSFRCTNGPNVSKPEILASLHARKFAVKCAGAGRAAAAGTFMPVLSFQVKLDQIFPCARGECQLRLPEAYDVSALAQYLHGHLHRRENVEILAETWQKLSNKKKGAGRPSPEDKKARRDMQERADKLLQAEQTADKLLEVFQPKRHKQRKTTKSADVKTESVEGCEVEATYHYSGLESLRSRKQADGVRAQKFSRRMQRVLLPGTHDLDIENSLFCLCSQLLSKMSPQPAMPEDAQEALVSCCKDRAGVCSKMGASISEGKRLLVSLFYGATLPKRFQSLEDLHELQKAAIYAKWVASSALPEEYQTVKEQEDKRSPEASLLAHFYFACEDFILSQWVDFLQKTWKFKHLSLHYDGVRVSSLPGVDVADICKQCEEHIAAATGFEVRIREKHHRSMIEIYCVTRRQRPQAPGFQMTMSWRAKGIAFRMALFAWKWQMKNVSPGPCLMTPAPTMCICSSEGVARTNSVRSSWVANLFHGFLPTVRFQLGVFGCMPKMAENPTAWQLSGLIRRKARQSGSGIQIARWKLQIWTSKQLVWTERMPPQWSFSVRPQIRSNWTKRRWRIDCWILAQVRLGTKTEWMKARMRNWQFWMKVTRRMQGKRDSNRLLAPVSNGLTKKDKSL